MGRTGVQLGFTAVGTAVGAYFGNPMLGAQIGSVVGGIAGALIFPPEDVKGPRLGDLRVGDASYGLPIPLVYGTVRVAGNMIWTSGIEERATEESLKGGGPTSTSYAYYSSFAIGLCEGPLESVRKLWLDTKLVYDMSTGNLGVVNQRVGALDPRGILDAGELADRREAIEGELADVMSALTMYLGTETQLPDPVMEAHEGVGQVPAHRGMAYLVFQDLPLAAYGNRIPNISAEVMSASAPGYPRRTLAPTPFALQKDNLVLDAPRQKLWTEYNGIVTEVDALNNTIVRTQTIDTSAWEGTIRAGLVRYLEVDQDGALYLPITSPVSPNFGRLVRIDPVSLAVTHAGLNSITLEVVDVYAISTIVTSARFVWATSWGLGHDAYCFLRPGAIDPQTGQPVQWMYFTGLYRISESLSGQRGQGICIDQEERAWIVCSGAQVAVDSRTFILVMDYMGLGTMFDVSDHLQAGEAIAYDAQTHSVLVFGRVPIPGSLGTAGRVIRFDCATQEVVESADVELPGGYTSSSWRRGIQGRQIWFADNFTTLLTLDVDTLTVTREVPINVGYGGGSNAYGGVYDAATNALWVIESGAGLAKYYFDRTEPGTVTLGSIVQDLSRRAGLVPDDLDTSALTAPVWGYAIAQQVEARASLEALLSAFLADGVETDWHLHFTHRALLPVATLTPDDLAAHEPGATLPDVLTPERLDDQALPMRLDVTYADPARDYQDTTQHARRMQAGQRARSNREVRVPVVLTADQAKQLAEQSLSEAWVSRTTYRLPVTYRWTTLDPGDVIAVDAPGRAALLRLTQIQHGANGILEMQGVAYDRAIYTASMSVGVIGDAPPAQMLTMHAPTGLFLLDTHLLRDVDEGSGYYLAMAPQGSGGWSGATAFSSVDGNAWRMEDTLTTALDYGSANTMLEAGSPYVIDTGHTVDVTMARGILSSISEAELINGMNGGLLGHEILQWQTATPLSATTYRLSNLLRGRRGTEWALTDHRVGERFLVLSPATLRREEMGLSEVSTVRLYRGVSMNTDMLTTTTQAFTNTALGLKPYSPDHVHGTRNTAQDLTITWTRRTRLGGLWVDGRDVPLGESREAYEVAILDAGATIRLLQSIEPSVIYSAADQLTDFGAPQSSVDVVVYQLGQLGRGWPAAATL